MIILVSIMADALFNVSNVYGIVFAKKRECWWIEIKYLLSSKPTSQEFFLPNFNKFAFHSPLKILFQRIGSGGNKTIHFIICLVNKLLHEKRMLKKRKGTERLSILFALSTLNHAVAQKNVKFIQSFFETEWNSGTWVFSWCFNHSSKKRHFLRNPVFFAVEKFSGVKM